jgi:hypothetical protein
LVVGLLLSMPLLTPVALRQSPLHGRGAVRLLGYLLPSLSAYVCLPLALALWFVPELPLDQPSAWSMPAVLVALIAFRPGERVPLRERVRRLGSVVVAALLSAAAAMLILPQELVPPTWLYR